jgi:hypothetical protein
VKAASTAAAVNEAKRAIVERLRRCEAELLGVIGFKLLAA